MVSTRKMKFIFTENEKVLCYEPDPKKAKVLYESKVLECLVGKDSSGRKCPQYLVHFYGWNSSWDRIVKTADIVKDNPQNRQLQRSLAEKAAIALKGKKLKLNKIPAIIKDIVVNSTTNSAEDVVHEDNDDSTDMSVNEPQSYEVDEELTQEETDRQSNESSDLDDYNSLMSCRTSVRTSVSNDCNTMSESNTCEEPDGQSVIYCLTNELKDILDKDYQFCAIDKCLYDLPQNPNCFEIIDEFEINHNFFITSDPNVTTSDSNQTRIVTEFKNSIQIYFNALIDNHYLFYNEEEKQQLRQLQQQSDHTLDVIKIYGFVHLLRLLVSMSDFLLSTPGMTKKQLKTIVKLIQHFIDYLTKNRDLFHN